MKAKTDEADTAEAEPDRLGYTDVVIAKTIDEKTTNEVALALARQQLGHDGECALVRGSAAKVLEKRRRLTGDLRAVKLFEIADGRCQLALMLGRPFDWMGKTVARFDRQIITCDAEGETWLLESNGHHHGLGRFDPEEIAEVVGCVIDSNVTFDLPPQGWSENFLATHFTADDVTDEQRAELVEKLTRLRSRGYPVAKKRGT